MPALIRVMLKGTMPNGEVWSVNPVWKMDVGDFVTNEELAAAASAIESITYPTTLAALHSTNTRLAGVRLEARELDGTLTAQAERTFGTAFAGTGSVSHPFQTSAVFSLRSGTAGASGRGRAYWPATGVSLDSTTLRIASSVLTSALTGFRTYMLAIEAAITTNVTDVSLAVWSRKNSALYPVVNVQAGDVADVQRRRRDAVPETYSTLAYPS